MRSFGRSKRLAVSLPTPIVLVTSVILTEVDPRSDRTPCFTPCNSFNRRISRACSTEQATSGAELACIDKNFQLGNGVVETI